MDFALRSSRRQVATVSRILKMFLFVFILYLSLLGYYSGLSRDPPLATGAGCFEKTSQIAGRAATAPDHGPASERLPNLLRH